MSAKNIKSKGTFKKRYGKTAYSKTKGKSSLSTQVARLSKSVSTLRKVAAPEWLTAPLMQAYTYNSNAAMTWFGINQDSGRALYIGPNIQGSADGQVKSDTMDYKFLELNLSIIPGSNALAGIVGQEAGNLLPTGTASMPGGIDYFYGNRIRVMIVFNTLNTTTGNGLAQASPILQNMLTTNSYVPSVGNNYLDLIGAYYDEDTGGSKKDHWVLYDQVLDMNKLGTINDNVESTTTSPWLAGEYTHRIKLDLKSCPRAKIQTFYNASGVNYPDLFDHGMLSLHVFSNKCGPVTSSTYNSPHGDKWYAGVTGRLVYTCP